KIVMGELVDTNNEAAHSFDELNDKTRLAADAFGRLFGEVMGVKEANLEVAQAWADTRKELLNGKRTLDESTQAGRDNVGQLNDMVGALERKREADIAAGNGT